MLSEEKYKYMWISSHHVINDNTDDKKEINYVKIGYPENFYKDLAHKAEIDNKRLNEIRVTMGDDPLSYIERNIRDRDRYYTNLEKKSFDNSDMMILSLTPLSIIVDQFGNDSINDLMTKLSRFGIFSTIYNNDICIIDSSVDSSVQYIVDLYMSELKFLIEHKFM